MLPGGPCVGERAVSIERAAGGSALGDLVSAQARGGKLRARGEFLWHLGLGTDVLQ